ncbi:MAG: thioredoxin-disulfide reductase [Streptococcaceae bacterium]|nr:thioredoxin-disulfide reductase [Streptococcaceae bacterium]
MYDVIIIGAGPAGMTTALYAARSNLKILLLEQGTQGGQMNNTAEIENYPGFASIMGAELSFKMYESLTKFGIEITYGVVQRIEVNENNKAVITEDKMYTTKTIVIATGAVHKRLKIPGEAEYVGRGVSYCAICDGAFFRDKELIVVGGGDSAVEEAIFLTRFASQVTIIHRRNSLRAQKIIQNHAFANSKIKFLWNTLVEEVQGDEQSVTQVRVKNKQNNSSNTIPCNGVFIYIGLNPHSEPFFNLGITDQNGWIKTDAHMKTNIPGIFAIGDVRKKTLCQITTAVGEGAIAAQQIYLYLQKTES